MGLFGTGARVDSRLGPVLIGGTPEDVRRIGKSQGAVLGVLRPAEQLIFVAADTHSGFVWALTDQRLLEACGKSVAYDLALSEISGTEVRHVTLPGDRDVRWCCFVYWRGEALQALSGMVNRNGFLMLERSGGQDEIRRMAALIEARVADVASAPPVSGPAAEPPRPRRRDSEDPPSS
jgi:hypothetical protein